MKEVNNEEKNEEEKKSIEQKKEKEKKEKSLDNLERRPADNWEKRANWDHKYRHQNFSVDVDVWYPMLKDITFKTYFIHLTHKEAKAIVHYFMYRFINKQVFTLEDTNILINLEKKIDYYFQIHPDLKDGALFRCTGRSGKDGGVYDTSVLYNEYISRLKKVTNLPPEQIKDANLKYTCLPIYNNMKVRNGKELLSVLLSSERLYHDMKDWLIHGGREQIVLRKWDNRLRPQDEFRVFVKDGKLRAACQYDREGKYDELIEKKDILQNNIHDFFYNKLAPLMKIKDYAVDFGYLEGDMTLIEFSPLIRCTSARYFRWDNNYKEMTEGDGKLTLRETEYPDIKNSVRDFERYYKSPSEHYDDFFIKEKESYYGMFTRYLSYLNPFNIYNYFFGKQEIKYHVDEKLNNSKIIFVVSVLKDQFYWSKKYIRYDDNINKFLGEGILEGHIIGIDKNGFGWIVEKENRRCKGQVFEVDEDDFIDIEYYYGLDDEKMKEVNVKILNKEIKAYAFVKKEIEKKLIDNKGVRELEEYDLNMQKKYFNPMQHIINQQEKYLNMSLDFDIKDSW